MNFGNWVNNSGIILEIIGFVLILRATTRMQQGEGNFSSDHVKEVMSITRPRFYYAGIVLVIVGLGRSDISEEEFYFIPVLNQPIGQYR